MAGPERDVHINVVMLLFQKWGLCVTQVNTYTSQMDILEETKNESD